VALDCHRAAARCRPLEVPQSRTRIRR
jgi:hypothetical protein